jgi:hypothetical protein
MLGIGFLVIADYPSPFFRYRNMLWGHGVGENSQFFGGHKITGHLAALLDSLNYPVQTVNIAAVAVSSGKQALVAGPLQEYFDFIKVAVHEHKNHILILNKNGPYPVDTASLPIPYNINILLRKEKNNSFV